MPKIPLLGRCTDDIEGCPETGYAFCTGHGTRKMSAAIVRRGGSAETERNDTGNTQKTGGQLTPPRIRLVYRRCRLGLSVYDDVLKLEAAHAGNIELVS